MNMLHVDGTSVAVDQEGFLVDLNDWSEPVAEALADAEGLTLQAEHWEVLRVLREFYQEFQLSPATRPLIKYTALKLGPEKGNSMHLNRLFKGTPAKLAAKLAGLPKPSNCI
ncbi:MULTISPECIES: TusE/DsrC/DsvC family sulfur relay protein [Pseudomonas]|uniref:Sulfurtransferase n=1 Tax=Pseudomonas knackmussii TaxID=65741 RepID=A0ABY4KUB7_9PSED|nr:MULTISPECIES: TusE/DsrC/DsvC family sulfur relay protein [Pseudomonas]UPQ84467.1 TusE/DsrC/DsvC family sulfur relay protein [Pseudomonas knackmussii]